nr:reverse transcriptase domain-containing protein [Tanacetum cinerariifolium]
MLLYKQAKKGVPLQAEQYDWLADTDEEIDKKELEAHYSYMVKILEVPTADTCTDSEPLEQNKHTEFEKYKAFNDRTINYDKLECKLNETLGQLAQKDIEIKEGLRLKAYEISVVKEKNDELIKQILLTKSHYEGLVKQKTKVITDLKLKEEHDIDKMLSMKKQLKVLNKIVYKRNQSIQTIHMMAPKVPTYNGRRTFSNPRYLKQVQSEIPCLFAFPYDQSTHANRLIPDGEETLALERESGSKLNKDSQEMHVDLKYVESLENEIDKLESDKAEFSNMYDMILQENAHVPSQQELDLLFGPLYDEFFTTVQAVATTDDSLAVPEHTTVKTPMNMYPVNKAYFKSEKEVIHLIFTGIGDEIYSTVDACQTAQEMWEAIERLQQGESLNIQDVAFVHYRDALSVVIYLVQIHMRPEVPPSPDYIPGPEYPEYLPSADDVFPAEEQPACCYSEDEEEEHLALTVPAPALHSSISTSEDSDKTEPFEEGETAATPPPSAYRVTVRISIQPHIPMPFPSKSEVERLLAIPTPPLSPVLPTSYPLPPFLMPLPIFTPLPPPPPPIILPRTEHLWIKPRRQCHDGMNTTSRENASKTDDRIDKIADQVSTFVDIFAKKVVTPAPVKAVEESCVTCGGAHAYYNCPNTDSNQPSVCAATTDPRVPLILGRSFLRTGHALIDVYKEEVTLRVNDEAVTFNLNQTMRYSSTYDDSSVNRIDIIDVAREEYAQEILGFSNNSLGGNPTSTFEPILSDSSHSLTPFEGSDFILEEINAYLKDESISLEIDHVNCDPKGDICLVEKLLNDDPF